jgi:hypothetical protein
VIDTEESLFNGMAKAKTDMVLFSLLLRSANASRTTVRLDAARRNGTGRSNERSSGVSEGP